MKKDPFEPAFGYAGVAEANPKKYEVRVGEKTFPMRRWREGILYFLFGIWSGKKEFWREPSICFGELKLTLKTLDCRVPHKDDIFVIEGVAPDDKYRGPHYGNYSLSISNRRSEVMDALARFVKDPYVSRVDIRLDDDHHLVFFGKERGSSEYGCLTY